MYVLSMKACSQSAACHQNLTSGAVSEAGRGLQVVTETIRMCLEAYNTSNKL